MLDTIHTLSCYAEGGVGDVIIDGVEPPPGRTVAEMRDFIEADSSLRSFILHSDDPWPKGCRLTDIWGIPAVDG